MSGKGTLIFGSSVGAEPPDMGHGGVSIWGDLLRFQLELLYHGNSLLAWDILGWFWCQQQHPAQGVKHLVPSWWVLTWFWGMLGCREHPMDV